MRWLWFGLGFCVVALVLLAQWPATMTARWVSARTPVELRDATGTLWNGNAGHVNVAGLDAGQLHWKVSPWSVLRRQPRATLELSGAEMDAQMAVSRRPGGATEISALQASLPGAWLQRILADTGLGMRGRVQINISEASLDADGWLQALEGEATWQRAQVVGSIIVDLGDLQVAWTTPQAGRIVGQLSDAGGPLQLRGQAIIENRQYRITAQLAARGNQPELQNALYSLARPDDRGLVNLNWYGPMLSAGETP